MVLPTINVIRNLQSRFTRKLLKIHKDLCGHLSYMCLEALKNDFYQSHWSRVHGSFFGQFFHLKKTCKQVD